MLAPNLFLFSTFSSSSMSFITILTSTRALPKPRIKPTGWQYSPFFMMYVSYKYHFLFIVLPPDYLTSTQACRKMNVVYVVGSLENEKVFVLKIIIHVPLVFEVDYFGRSAGLKTLLSIQLLIQHIEWELVSSGLRRLWDTSFPVLWEVIAAATLPLASTVAAA